MVHFNSDMTQVVHHMCDVVVHHEFQSERARVANGTGSAPCRFRDSLCRRQQLLVQRTPKLNQVVPIALLIMMQYDPALAIVGWHCRMLLELRAHDTLVIISGGVQQVAEFFLTGPCGGIRLHSHFGLGQSLEAFWYVV